MLAEIDEFVQSWDSSSWVWAVESATCGDDDVVDDVVAATVRLCGEPETCAEDQVDLVSEDDSFGAVSVEESH